MAESREEEEAQESRRRVRRPADLLLGLLALVAVAVLFGVAHGLPIGTRELTDQVSSWLGHDVPRVLAFFCAALSGVGCMVLAVLAVVSLLRDRRGDFWNALVAFCTGLVVGLACVAAWQGRRGGVAVAMLRGTNATVLVAIAAFVAFLTGTDLVRRPRWRRWCLLVAGALLVTVLALDDLTSVAFLVAPLAGWGIGQLVRWALGAASVRPSTGRMMSWLHEAGVEVAALEEREGRQGYEGTLVGGARLEVWMANRDTRGAGVVTRLWHSLRLSGAATGTQGLSRRSQLEQEALAAYATAAAGVTAPRVLLLAELPPETLVLVLSRPVGCPLGERPPHEELAALFGALHGLHRAGVAHRDLRPQNLVVGGAGAGFASLERAQPASGEVVRRLDVAQLLTTVAGLVGAAEAVKALREGYPPQDEEAVAAILQPVALVPWGWTAMRAARGCLAELRRELVGPEGTAPPLRLERFRWRTVVSTIGLTVAAFILVGELSRVDLAGAIREMNPGWFLVAILGSALTYLGAALNLAAFVPKRLSLLRGFFVQLSSAFVGMAMPPTVGHVAVNGRYLHRQEVEEGAITAAVAVSQIVNVVTTVILLLVIGLLTGSGVSHLKVVPSADLLIGLACVVVILAALAAVPRTRRELAVHVWPHLKSAVPRLLEAISEPVRLGLGVLGNLLLTAGYVLALLAALWAVGAHPAVLPVAAVYLAGNAVGSVAPTPGGLGAVEAVMTAALTAIGIPAHEAVPGVLVFRVATFWLPIPAGWGSYLALQRSGTL